MSQSAQNSITVRRLRNGDTLFLTIEQNSVPLYQSVDEATGNVTPSWGTGDGQVTPLLKPKATSARGNSVALSGHEWQYNGTTLVFDGDTVTINGTSYTKSTTDDRFAMSEDGALVIIGNLASKTNLASDTLTYTCTATCAGNAYTLTKTVDVQIQNGGSSAYYGVILADTQQLTADVTEANLATQLFLGGTSVSEYYVKWYKDTDEWTDKAGQANPTVRGSDIDGTQLFIARFYASETAANAGGDPLFVAAIRLIDTNDEIHVQYRYVNSDGTTTGTPAREIGPSQPVYIQAYVVNTRTNTEITTGTFAWTMKVMDKDKWTALYTKTGTAANIMCTLTTDYTDVDGAEKDIEVVTEVTIS